MALVLNYMQRRVLMEQVLAIVPWIEALYLAYIGGVLFLACACLKDYENLLAVDSSYKHLTSQPLMDVIASIVISLWPIVYLVYRMTKISKK